MKRDSLILRILHGDESVLDEFGFTEDEKKEIIEYGEKRRKRIIRMAKRLGESAGKTVRKIMQDIMVEETK